MLQVNTFHTIVNINSISKAVPYFPLPSQSMLFPFFLHVLMCSHPHTHTHTHPHTHTPPSLSPSFSLISRYTFLIFTAGSLLLCYLILYLPCYI